MFAPGSPTSPVRAETKIEKDQIPAQPGSPGRMGIGRRVSPGAVPDGTARMMGGMYARIVTMPGKPGYYQLASADTKPMRILAPKGFTVSRPPEET